MLKWNKKETKYTEQNKTKQKQKKKWIIWRYIAIYSCFFIASFHNADWAEYSFVRCEREFFIISLPLILTWCDWVLLLWSFYNIYFVYTNFYINIQTVQKLLSRVSLLSTSSSSFSLRSTYFFCCCCWC